jgi:aldehyde:ferredoxin oxidoreductase
MNTGYMGQILRVDLSSGGCTIETIDENKARKFVGGVGYAAEILFNELKPGIDPLGQENKIVFATSPLSDNIVPGGGSVSICFKSPLSNAWGESRSGGNFGPDLRRAGFDLVIFEGKSEKPVYLEILDGKASLKDASLLVGKDVYEKTELIEEEMPSSIKHKSVMCIGPAGENQVSFASIMCRDRAAGRSGGGAVMGSKNILAIAVAGSLKVNHANPKAFMAAVKKAVKTIRENEVRDWFNEFGTTADLAGADESGDFPTKNWRTNNWGFGTELFDHFQKENLIRPNQCYSGCPIGCGRVCQVKEGPYKTPEHEGGEYETVAAFTAFSLNKDMDAAVHCGYLCNKWGMDTISAGAMIAFAMDCYNEGILTKEETEGIDLSWGNTSALPLLVEKIAFRKGFGDILANGVRAAAEKIGNGADKLAIHVKGMEGPAHDARSSKTLGLGYGTASRGMCHIHPLEGMSYDKGKMDFGMQKYGVRDPEQVGQWDEKGKGKDTALLQRGLILPDVLTTCKFMCYAGITPDHWAEMLSGTTGWDINGEELIKVGERVLNLQRMFNVRESLGRKDDMLPERVLSMPESGDFKDEKQCIMKDYDALLDEYYEACGWDKKTGVPTREKLVELGLDF